MKRVLLVLAVSLLVLAAPTLLPGYELEPNNWKVVPECIWATASGGGTWTTEIQIINFHPTSDSGTVNAYFYPGDGTYWGPFAITTGLDKYHAYRTTNILSTLDNLDDNAAHVYSGKVGAVWFFTSSDAVDIQVIAKTHHSAGYSKSFPGMLPSEGTTAAYGRNMVLQGLYNGSAYRSWIGIFNTNNTTSATVTCRLMNYNNVMIGDVVKTIPANGFTSFNPWAELGISSQVNTNAYLWIRVDTVAYTAARGLMFFASIANNSTNDPNAVIAYPLTLETTSSSTTLPPPGGDPTL